MAPPPKEMSSIISWGLIRKWAERWQNRLPLWIWDRIYWFVIQTRLLFSVTILLIVGALMLLFIWATIGLAIVMATGQLATQLEGQGVTLAQVIHSVLFQQAIFLTIVMHMNQWEVERDDRTFELLIMRIPNIHRLIWFKLFVSITWVFILLFPVYLGLSLFADTSLASGLSILIFCLMSALTVALFTCVIASFVHHPLATGFITLILTFVGAAILDNPAWPKPYAHAFQIFIYPPMLFDPAMIKDSLQLLYAILNRLFYLFVTLGIYWWLYRRLSQTEKWI
jgi:hypothetical protein